MHTPLRVDPWLLTQPFRLALGHEAHRAELGPYWYHAVMNNCNNRVRREFDTDWRVKALPGDRALAELREAYEKKRGNDLPWEHYVQFVVRRMHGLSEPEKT